MNPQMKRSLPIIAVLGAAVVGVYVVGPERLTGDASRIHQQHEALGPIDDRLYVALDKIAAEPTLPMTTGPQLEQLGQLAEQVASNPAALATLTNYFRDNGCVQPGSPSLVQLIGHLSTHQRLEAAQRQHIVDVLVDAASHAAPSLQVDLQNGSAFASAPQLQAWVASIENGETVALTLQPPRLELETSTAQCVHLAVAAATALAADLPEAELVHELSAKTLASLPANHPSTDAWVRLAIESARFLPEARPTLELAALPNLGTSSRNMACKAAAAKGASLDELRARLGADPAAIRPCLVDAGDKEAIREALSSEDRALRVQALSKLDRTPDLELAGTLIEPVFDPELDIGPRETRARLKAYARTVVASDDPGKMLKPVDDLMSIHPKRDDVPRLLAALMLEGDFSGVEFEEEDSAPTPVSTALAQLARGEPGVRLSARFRPARLPTAADGANPTSLSAARPGGLEVAGAPGAGQPELAMAVPGANPNTPRARDNGAGLTVADSLYDRCDVVVGPDDLREYIARLEAAGTKNAVVCARAGRYPGNIVLDAPGLVLRSLEPRGAVFEGAVVLEQGATLIDFVFEKPVAVSPIAARTQLSGNEIKDRVVSLTTDLILVGNTQSEGRSVDTPMGQLDARHYLPPALRFVPERFVAMAQARAARRDKVDSADEVP